MARNGESARSLTLGQEVRFLPSACDDGGVLRVEVTQAAGLGVPAHVHPVQEERFHVAEGEISLRIGRRRLDLSAGQSATVPPGSAHSFRACSRGGARLLNEFRPALRTDDCFARTFGAEQVQPLARRLRELGQIAEAYPREFLFYVPGIPWQLQRTAIQQLARVRLWNDRVQSDRSLANRWLAIYMNDQLAAGVLWREVARRAARENAGEQAGAPLSELAEGIAAALRGRLPNVDFDEPLDRAAVQRALIEPLREGAGRAVLPPG